MTKLRAGDEKPEAAKGSKSTPMQLVRKGPERRVKAVKPARHPTRRATDFPTDSTAIPARNRPGDAAILEQTGKSWREWFMLLNAAGADREERKKIISENTDAHSRWRNVVLIAYELDSGVREQYAKPEGYEISVARVINVPVADLFAQWSEDELRNHWLGAKKIVIRKATLNKSVRITWDDGTTLLNVDFHSLAAGKTRVLVHHQKLPQRQVSAMREFWTQTLRKLKKVAEAG